jgi:hypothetical protein
MTDPIFERVLGAIKRVAGADGYDLIVDRATVAFSRSDLDLTDRVIQMANGAPGSASAPSAAGGGAAATGASPRPPAQGAAAKP